MAWADWLARLHLQPTWQVMVAVMLLLLVEWFIFYMGLGWDDFEEFSIWLFSTATATSILWWAAYLAGGLDKLPFEISSTTAVAIIALLAVGLFGLTWSAVGTVWLATIALVAGTVWFVNATKSWERDEEVATAIMSDISDLRPHCRNAHDSTDNPLLPRRNKVLVWDMTSNTRSAIHDHLENSLKMHYGDSHVTVVMVLGQRKELEGYYSVSGQPAYVVYVDVCLANWPEKYIIGQTAVTGSDPRESRVVQEQPEAGEFETAVAEWIERLP